MSDHYGVLGVSRSSTKAQIKDAYRRNARRLHPDVNPDPWAGERFKEMTHAYEVLSNDQARADYDAQPRDDQVASAYVSQDDRTFLFICKEVMQTLQREQQVQHYARNQLRSDVYRVASEMMQKSLKDYEAALNHPLVTSPRPVVVAMAQKFLDTVDPNETIGDQRSSEHLRTGALGMVGLTRVLPIVGRNASPQGKEAAARSVMFALGRALLEAGLVKPRAAAASMALGGGLYEKQAQNAFAELEQAVGEPLAG